MALGFICFVVGFVAGVWLAWLGHQMTWKRNIVGLVCAGCSRWLAKDGGVTACEIATGHGFSALPNTQVMQGEWRDISKFATRHGWTIQVRPLLVARCPECASRQASFHQENAA